MLAGWVLASSVCAQKHAGWVISVVSMSQDDSVADRSRGPGIETGPGPQNSIMQYTAAHCNTLQHTATHCNSRHTIYCNTYVSNPFRTQDWQLLDVNPKLGLGSLILCFLTDFEYSTVQFYKSTRT